ncbi:MULTISPECIES: beta-ketoacyl-ACP synthase III [Cysteiniphilum]|uniref:beta-ketoacyl-ACP synthase III n=1 Tax=Cysteiniphilum TaxID=2056696 RepID=UPI00177EA2D9|nr:MULTISPECIES: beta-ketoacyl-ACP synthase III [Cysteiniphilum]
MFAKITGTGSYLPAKVLHNTDIAKMVDTSDEWITQRVGIKQRHIANESETTAHMAIEAAKNAMELANIQAQDIDLIIVATGTADYIMPSTASIVQTQIGAPCCPAFDISAACSGFVYAVDIAKQYIENGSAKNALVIASERMSRTLDWQDRATCVLFGDGAGAIILSQSVEAGIIASTLYCDGEGKDMLNIPGLLSKIPFTQAQYHAMLHMEGNKVFKKAVSKLSDLVSDLLTKANMCDSDIDWLVPHQANYRILEATAKKLNMPMSQVIITLENHGNTSAASIPLALDHAVRNNQIKPGQTILTEAFGAGLVWGGFIAKF